jgi:L-cysteine S-thiosulfotransferase
MDRRFSRLTHENTHGKGGFMGNRVKMPYSWGFSAFPMLRIACALGLSGVAAATMAMGPAPRAAQVTTAQDDGLPPVTVNLGNAGRGALLIRNREAANCILCHAAPGVAERESGTLAPSLAGAGTRWSAAQLRARVADNARFNPQTIMPAYFVAAPPAGSARRVAPEFAGKTLLSAQELEDIVAYLATLR